MKSYSVSSQPFQRGIVKFPGIDFEVKLKSNQLFRNDGAVNDLAVHVQNLIREFGEIDNKVGDDFSEYGGFSLQIDGLYRKRNVIFIQDTSPVQNQFLFGHESMHSLIWFGLEDKIFDKLKSEGVSLAKINSYSDEENICDFVGMYALWKKGYTLRHTNFDFMQIYHDFQNSLR